MTINYAQCWEDPAILRRALAIRPTDDILSVASGGDNSLALLLDNPNSVTAIDRNLAQVYLIELKIAALATLDYDDFVSFLGAMPCNNRIGLYRTVRTRLSLPARKFWDSRPADIGAGAIHCGKFERYLASFRRLVLPCVLPPHHVAAFLASRSLAEQSQLYDQVVDSRRWRLMFRLVFSRPALARFGRCQGAFAQVESINVATELLRRVALGLTSVPIGDNYIVRYALSGTFDLERCAPPYLQSGNFHRLRERIHRLRVVLGDLDEHLRNAPVGKYSAFNLSDVFEYMNHAQLAEMVTSLARVSRDDGRAAFWTVFIPWSVPEDICSHVTADATHSTRPAPMDRGIFYSSFNLWWIRAAIDRFDRTFARPVDQEAQR